MKAVIAGQKGGPAVCVSDRERPKLRPNGYMLVRPVVIALNPADVALVDYGMAEAGCLLGCDYAGIVEEVGPGVHRDFTKGDRVCGPMRAGDPHERENGTAAELICIKADMAMHIPNGMSFEDASTLGVTHITTGRCFYQKFNLPWPDEAEASPGYLFVYGGSSAMGTMLTQFAKLSNYQVITVCSPRNFELCKSFGADHVFDFHDADTVKKIRNIGGDSLKLCVDCISSEETAAFCANVLNTGGKYSSILLAKCPRDDVESFRTVGYSFLGEEWEQFGVLNPASPADFEYSKGFAELSERLLLERKIKPHPVDLRDGGLDAVPEALQDLRAKRVSGKKIVLRVQWHALPPAGSCGSCSSLHRSG